MAENSLFAILLRSPWWASLGIAVALALLMRLLLPQEYAVAGMLGSFPFVVIAAIAAWKQLRAPSASQLAQTLERLQAMNSREFADAIEAALYVATGALSDKAGDFVRETQLQLMGAPELAQLMRAAPKKR